MNGGQSVVVSAAGWRRINVNTANATLPLNMGGKQQVQFVPSAAIAAPKTWVVTNDNNAFEFLFRFTLSGVDAQTLPADFLMTDPLFNPATNVWTPIDAGDYEAHGTYDGTNWYLTIVGLYD